MKWPGVGLLALLALLVPCAMAEPLVSITDAEVTLDGTGGQAATVTVTLSEPAALPVTVDYATVNGTARAGEHYTATSGTLTIPANQTSGPITVPLLDFGSATSVFFTVELSAPTNATLTGENSIITIHPRRAGYSTGDAVPGAAAGTTFAKFAVPAINESGDMAFLTTISAGLVKKQAVFAEPGIVALQGDPAPGIAAAAFLSFKDPALNNDNAVAFIAKLSGAVNATNNIALFTDAGGPLAPVIRTGDPAPGLPGHILTQIHSFALTDDAIFFTCYLCNHRAAPAVHTYSLCVWTPANGLRLLMHEKQAFARRIISRLDTLLPTTTSPGYGRSACDEAITARLTFTDFSNAIVVLDAGGASEIIAETGDVAAGTAGATLTTFGRPVMNSARRVSVQVFLAGVAATGNAALFAGTASEFDRAYGVGDSLAGLPGLTITASDAPLFNDREDVASLVTLAGPGATRVNNKAIVFKPAGAAPVVAARLGDTPPGVFAGARWAAFKSIALPGDRGPVFLATMRPGFGGVSAATDVGLWAMDRAGVLRIIVREGDTIFFDGKSKKVRTFTALGVVPGSPDQSRSFSTNGRISFLATFTDGTKGVIRVRVP